MTRSRRRPARRPVARTRADGVRRDVGAATIGRRASQDTDAVDAAVRAAESLVERPECAPGGVAAATGDHWRREPAPAPRGARDAVAQRAGGDGIAAAPFVYRRPDGRVIRRPADLKRIASLAIPPAWTEVRIHPDPESELQAVGRDAAARLQYIYHPDFVQANAQRKWQRLALFARALPRLRDACQQHLRQPGLPRIKVLAVMTRVLQHGLLRAGSVRHLQRHRSHGLTTLLKRHATVEGTRVRFEFRGKSGIVQRVELVDASLARRIAPLLALPGRWLFQYRDDDGSLRPVRAAELNAYIAEHMGEFTCKDFRTWGGTLAAAHELAAAARAGLPTRQAVVATVRKVAETLGNTPAVARASYICPVIIDRYLDGEVIAVPRARPPAEGRAAPAGSGRARSPLPAWAPARGLSAPERALGRLLARTLRGDTAAARQSRKTRAPAA